MDDFLQLWREGRLLYGDPMDSIVSYWQLRPHPNLLFLTYEEGHVNLMTVLRKMATFIGKSPSDALLQQMCEHLQFDKMQHNGAVNLQHKDAYKGKYIRRGQVGSWRDELTHEQCEEIDRRYEARIRQYKLPITYTLTDQCVNGKKEHNSTIDDDVEME